MYSCYDIIRNGESYYYKGEYICLDDCHCMNIRDEPIPWLRSCCRNSGVKYLEKFESGVYKFYFKIYESNCNTEKV